MPSVYVMRILLVFFMLTSHLAFSQKLKDLVKSGDQAMADKDYYTASIYFNKALLKDSSDLYIQYNYAQASRLNYDYTQAEYWYNKLFKKDNGRLYPDALFWLAELKKANGKYKEAKKLFDRYSRKYKKKNPVMAAKALQQKEACDVAQLLIKDPLEINIEHLDSKVNTSVSEYAPLEMDSILYFSSLRENTGDHSHINKLYKAKRIANGFEQAEILDTIINDPKEHTANAVFDKTGNRMYFTRCTQINGSEFRCKILFSQKDTSGKWIKGTPLTGEINKNGFTYTQPSCGILNGKEVLFFASDVSIGKGGMDIFYCLPDSIGYISEIKNAGDLVNSHEDEITPFFCTPCQKLYFSSTWHHGLGGFDIFEATYDGQTFSKPSNSGYPVNSRYNDIYFSISDDFKHAYFSSNRLGSFFEDKATCCNDIYTYELPGYDTLINPEKIDSTKLIVNKMKLLVPLTLYFHNDEPDAKTLSKTTVKNYEATYKDYIVLLEKYKKEYSQDLKGDEKDRAILDIEEFFEDSVTAGMNDLRKFAELLEIVLQKGEKVEITMKGYCSPLASTDYNKNLASRRISSLRNYFRNYKDGAFLKYLDSQNGDSQLKLVDVGIGEIEKSITSDNPNDQKNSVYSRSAALERKIQIIAFSTETLK